MLLEFDLNIKLESKSDNLHFIIAESYVYSNTF